MSDVLYSKRLYEAPQTDLKTRTALLQNVSAEHILISLFCFNKAFQ